MHTYMYTIYPSIHRSMGSAPVGAQCKGMCPHFLTIGEFLGFRDWLWYPGLSPVLVSIAIPYLAYLGVFYSLSFPCHWISFIYFFTVAVSAPTTNPPPHSRLGTGTMVTGYPKRLRYHGGGVMHVCIYVCMYTCIQMYRPTYIHTCIQLYIHTFMYTYRWVISGG